MWTINLSNALPPKTHELDTLQEFNPPLWINAGDDIGYLGKFEIPRNIEADEPTIESRYQVHFELFSKEQPPEAFLMHFFAESDKRIGRVSNHRRARVRRLLKQRRTKQLFQDLSKAMTLEDERRTRYRQS